MTRACEQVACIRVSAAPGVGSSATAIYNWIRSLPGLKVSNVVKDASVGGLSGYRIDLDIDAHSAGTSVPEMTSLPARTGSAIPGDASIAGPR